MLRAFARTRSCPPGGTPGSTAGRMRAATGAWRKTYARLSFIQRLAFSRCRVFAKIGFKGIINSVPVFSQQEARVVMAVYGSFFSQYYTLVWHVLHFSSLQNLIPQESCLVHSGLEIWLELQHVSRQLAAICIGISMQRLGQHICKFFFGFHSYVAENKPRGGIVVQIYFFA